MHSSLSLLVHSHMLCYQQLLHRVLHGVLKCTQSTTPFLVHAALAKMKNDWLTPSDTIRNAAADQARSLSVFRKQSLVYFCSVF